MSLSRKRLGAVEGGEGFFDLIDVGPVDYGSLSTTMLALMAAQAERQKYKTSFRMPNIVFPTVLTDEFGQLAMFESSTVRNQRVALFNGVTQAAFESGANPNLKVSSFDGGLEQQIAGTPTDGFGNAPAAGHGFAIVDAFNFRFNGTNWDRMKTGATKAVPASGASPLTIYAAAGVGLKRRVFDILISSSVAGLVVLSDGLGTMRVGTVSGVYFHYGPDGILQDTANTAITATLATATLEAIAVGNAGE